MPRLFHRVISFDVEGELYDNDTTPESVLRNYNWHCDNKDLNEIKLVGKHHDIRGRIVNLKKLSKISRSSIRDTNYYLI
jgi:hypothetical protein